MNTRNTPEEDDNDTPNEADYAAVIRANLEQRKLQPIEEIIHDNTIPYAMGPIKKKRTIQQDEDSPQSHEPVDLSQKRKLLQLRSLRPSPLSAYPPR